MAKKTIDLGNGLSVVFDQRAKGEETPYWQGRIFKDGQHVGGFSNNGRGGATMVHPPAMSTAFVELVDKTLPEVAAQVQHERDNLVLQWAEMKGYTRGCGSLTLETFLQLYLKEMAALMTPRVDPPSLP